MISTCGRRASTGEPDRVVEHEHHPDRDEHAHDDRATLDRVADVVEPLHPFTAEAHVLDLGELLELPRGLLHRAVVEQLGLELDVERRRQRIALDGFEQLRIADLIGEVDPRLLLADVGDLAVSWCSRVISASRSSRLTSSLR
jgi:hypothetical protein